MPCPLCAEEIQDAAVVCRFCGARKGEDGAWSIPEATRHPNSFTIKSSAVLFLIGAVMVGFRPTAPVVLFGGELGTPASTVHNILYAGLLLWVGAGLWNRSAWTLKSVVAFTVFYSVQKLDPLIFNGSLDAIVDRTVNGEVMRALRGLTGGAGVQRELIAEQALMVSGACLLLWLGFAAWLWMKRDYFSTDASRN